MKAINRIFFYISALVMSLLMTSCDPALTTELGEPDDADCYGVYFPSQAGTGDHQVGPKDTKSFKFKARRVNTRGRLEVPVVVESNYPGVFSTTELIFEEDAPTAEIEVFFPTIKLGTKYECTLKVEGSEYVSSYSQNATHLSFSVTCVKWNKVIGDGGETTGLWRDGVIPEWFTVPRPNLEQEVEIYEREDLPGYYRIYDVYNSNYMSNMFGMDASSVCLEKHYTYIDATDPDRVWIPTFSTGIVMSADYGEMSMASYVVENDDFDASITSIYGTLKDGIITFPSGALHMNLAVLGWYPSNSYGLHRIILPGYRALETDITITPGVTGKDGKIPVKVGFGQDIRTVKLYAAEGSLSESEIASLVEQIAAGTLETTIPDMKTSGETFLSFDKTGEYTVMAVGLNHNNLLANHASAKFGYKKDPAEMPVEVNYGLICSNKYLPDGMTSENSLEIYINGKGIKRMNVALYEKERFEKYKEQYMTDLGNAELSEASLAQVNGEGLSLVQSGLAPGTEYVLVIKAYNGYSELEDIVSETTAGVWDYRLAYYDSDDADPMKVVDYRIDDFCPAGETRIYNYYAIEATNSRYCLGEVEISRTSEVYQSSYGSYPCLKVSGLFPHLRKTYGVKDDSMYFFFDEGCMWNYKFNLEYFIFEGMYIYTTAYLYGSNGSVYTGAGGIMGTFVQKDKSGAKPCIALMDSGMAAAYGLNATFNGFAVVGYEDSESTVMLGLMDLVESIILIPKEQDPNPLYKEEKTDEEDVEKSEAKIRRQMDSQDFRMNHVECDDAIRKNLNDSPSVRNYFDLESAYML